MAIDHQEAFPAEHENGKGKAGREEEGEEGGGAAADAAAPFATKAEGRKYVREEGKEGETMGWREVCIGE